MRSPKSNCVGDWQDADHFDESNLSKNGHVGGRKLNRNKDQGPMVQINLGFVYTLSPGLSILWKVEG